MKGSRPVFIMGDAFLFATWFTLIWYSGQLAADGYYGYDRVKYVYIYRMTVDSLAIAG
ncbi:MAG: hypothetical protein ACP5U1_01735 [Desulfomonilaceae bacterium]